MSSQLVGIDQFGTVYWGLKHPRKDLLAKLGYKKASKMYVDMTKYSTGEEGKTLHVGYVIGMYWVQVYELRQWEG